MIDINMNIQPRDLLKKLSLENQRVPLNIQIPDDFYQNLLTQLLAGLGFVLQVGQLLKQGAGFGFESRQGIAGGGVDSGIDFGQTGLNFRNAIHS